MGDSRMMFSEATLNRRRSFFCGCRRVSAWEDTDRQNARTIIQLSLLKVVLIIFFESLIKYFFWNFRKLYPEKKKY
jgi:hypothetical protein